MSLCNSIETLSMAYLDDELAAEERHELETHLAECASCRAHLERERADLSMVRRALVAPPASDMLRARVARGLDEVERTEKRSRLSRYLLPSSAVFAAVAAIVVFVGAQRPMTPTSPPKRNPHVATSVVSSAAKISRRPLPLEVEGPSTRQYLHQHFAADVTPPQFEESTKLQGARLLPNGVNGHDAAALQYEVAVPGREPFKLAVLVVRDLHGDEMRDGTPVRVNNRILYMFKTEDGLDMVSYVPRPGIAFLFMAPELTANELLGLASRVNLVSE